MWKLCGALILFLVTAQLQPLWAAEEPFIGWEGESYRPKQPNLAQQGGDSDATRRWIETVSWKPRAFIFHNFLSQDEANHVVNMVEHKVYRSSVIDTKTGVQKQDPIRTSFGGSIGRGEDAVIAAIEQRIAEWTRLPPENGEPIQVLRYMDGQKYDAHWDWFDDPLHAHGKDTEADNRVATVLMYLGEVEEGGETSLPLAQLIDPKRQVLVRPSECAKKGTLAVRPKKGDALLFWDILPDGKVVDRAALHASCPTLKGTKWTATKWIHKRAYGTGYDPLKLAAKCQDTATNCKKLADEGKCDSDAANMLGLSGKCRKTCQDCVDCLADDVICLRKNLRSLRLQKTVKESLQAAKSEAKKQL